MSGQPSPVKAAPRDRRDYWDAVGVTIASLVGLLALVVAGYTAYIQRQQVRAQVWPYLISGNNDLAQALTVSNKGVGPALVRSVQVTVDGKPQIDWDHVLVALGMQPHDYIMSTINHGVLSPGEDMQAIRFPDKRLWKQFHDATSGRVAIDICFCSTLGDCWVSINEKVIGPKSMPLQLHVKPIGDCPRLSPAETFNN
ncbi:MAG: hypothetical protein WA961_00525 [Rhodanobacter sp.]|jgi:hypothetical protein